MAVAQSKEDEIAALKAQMKMVAQRIEALENRKKQQVAKSDIRRLQEKVRDLEEERTRASRTRVYWKNGFCLEYSPEGSDDFYKMRIRTALQFRYTYVNTDNDVPSNRENYNSIIARRLRLFIDGLTPNREWKFFTHLQLEPDYGVNLHDATIQWQKYQFARIEIGRMKIPYSMESWQGGFYMNGADRTIFTGDSEADKDMFRQRTYDIPGDNKKLRVSNHLDEVNGFPDGGMLIFRSQGLDVNGYVDMFGMKQFLVYWAGIYNGRDSRGYENSSSDMLYSCRVGINFLSGSDPKGPMGPQAFNNYFKQGDYGFSTKPLAAVVVAGFQAKSRVYGIYNPMLANPENLRYGSEVDYEHDTNNYGFDASLLFRYKGFSADLEGAWEEFIQDPDHQWQETWDRWGARVNLGYFLVPKRWELTFKFAYMNRLVDADLENTLASGLGLVKLDDGYAIERDMQQYRAGINWYLHGFNQYICAEVGLFHRSFDKIRDSEAARLNYTGTLSDADKSQDDIRFRVQYQHWF